MEANTTFWTPRHQKNFKTISE